MNLKDYKHQWYLKNQKLMVDNARKYYNTPGGNKIYVIKNWIKRGVIDEDLGAVYDYYITQTHCWICDIEYNKNNPRCLDHDHDDGSCRYICCRICNLHTVR